MALYEIGEIRLRRGDLAAAEDAFRRADDLGKTPQPGLALLRLAQGKVHAASSLIASALEDESWDRLARARLLPAAVEIALAAGDAAGARVAADELQSIADTYGAPAFEAAARSAHGALLFAEGDAAAAATELRRGRNLWRQVGVPYELARIRLALAEVLSEQGDVEGGAGEAQAALAIFERLGAKPDTVRARRLSDGAGNALASNRQIVRTFMFTDIVDSTSLVEAMGDDSWAGVLRWHDEALRSRFTASQGEEIDQAGDGFFVAFADPDTAIACAVAIQRDLAEHRRAHGFSPRVRIGVHASTATTQGTGYQGKGVHRAARIGALAEGGEVLVSAETLTAASTPFETAQPRTVALKGMAEPATLVSVVWR
jgi:class 3 adenylate cyclase